MITFAFLCILLALFFFSLATIKVESWSVKVTMSLLRLSFRLVDVAGIAILLKIFVYCVDNFW